MLSYISRLFIWRESNKIARDRISVLVIIFTLLYLSIVLRLLGNITINNKNYSNNNNNIISRKEIIDRNSKPLVVNIPFLSLYAKPELINNPKESAKKLVKIFPDLEYKNIYSKLTSGKKFVWIKRDLSEDKEKLFYSQGLVGFDFERHMKRVYIQGSAMSHILGYVNRDGKGISGVEKFCDDILNPESKKDNLPLKLTISSRIQNIVSNELDEYIQKFNAKGGAGIVLDPNTGEVLSLVSKPDFDPHKPGDASDDQKFNKATLGIYELGSVVKPLIIAMGLDSKVSSINDVYNLDDFKMANYKIKDYHKNHGWHSLAEILIHSSNIGMAQIALEVGKEVFYEYINKFNLFSKSDIEIPEKASSIFPHKSKLTELSLVTMSYGYGMSLSPLKFVEAMIPIVNGGYANKVTLLKRDSYVKGKKILNSETSDSLNKLMRLVVKIGTGKKAEVNGYLVGGKTGTANKMEGNQYVQDQKRLSSFIGIMPTIKPKYLVFAFLDEPKGIKETFGFAGGGWTSAPLVGNILKKIAILDGMKTYDENNPEIKKLLHVDYKVQHESK